MAKRVFSDRWELTTQQLMSGLRDKVTVVEFGGKEQVFTDIGEVVWNETAGRLEDSNPQEVTGERRKLSKRDFSCQVIFDRTDKDYLEKELMTPGSLTEQSMKAAWARKMDELIAAGVVATVYGGADPYTTTIDITSAQEVAVNYVNTGSPANSGLTPWKLIELARKFKVNDVSVGSNTISGYSAPPVWLAIGPQQEADLWAYVQSSGNDVWAAQIAAYLNGQTNKLFGFSVVQSNRLPYVSGTGVRSCVAWAPSAMLMVPDKYEIHIDVLPQKKHAIQLSAYAKHGIMRRREEEVGVIYADEVL